MLRLSSHIKIFGRQTLIFDFVFDIEVDSSWKHLTDTAKITTAKKVVWDGQPIINGENSLLRVGDRVEIMAGYYTQRQKLFTGYITRVKPKLPVEIECEDEMWLLKQKTIEKFSKSGVTLTSLLKDISGGSAFSVTVNGATVKVPFVTTMEMTLGQFRISNATVAQVLEELRSTYNIQSFFRDGTLYVGLAYVPALQKTIAQPFDFTWNVEDASELEWRKKDDVKIKVTVTSKVAGAKDLKKVYGDNDGQAVNIKLNGASAADMDAIGNSSANSLKYTGFYGKFTAFGEPFVRHGDIITTVDPKLPEVKGSYIVRAVKYKFGEGFRQTIEPDFKVSH